MLKRSLLCMLLVVCLLLSCLPAVYADDACEHDYVGKAVEATCTEPSGTLYTCSKCGDTCFEADTGGAIDVSTVEITEKCPSKYTNNQSDSFYGKVEKITYYSNVANRDKQANVRFPLNYDENETYPVLYLLHGVMGSENDMVSYGKTIQNLVADGQTPNCFIVCPNMFSHPTMSSPNGINVPSMEGYDKFIDDLVDSLMPYMKQHYPIKEGKENTAVCGFSMGGRESLTVGLFRPDLFGYIGAFSPAPGMVPGVDRYMEHPGTFTVEEVNYDDREPPYLITICCGTRDSVVGTFPKQYHELFDDNGIEHVWWEIEGSDHGDPATSSGIYNFCRYVFTSGGGGGTPALGHDFGEWAESKPATCTEKGEESRKCSRCVETETREVDALGHDYVSVVTDPDCINPGYTHCTCSRCGDNYLTDFVEPLGHDFVNGVCARCGEKDPDAQPPFEFDDVKDEGKFYYAPIYWAVNHDPQITNGATETTFAPDKPCTRGHVVTFLWRAAGEPAPTSTNNPFTDLKEGAFYYTAVLWAVENGITTGASKTTFAPGKNCSRGQIVTFLWRFKGSPEPSSTENPFSDVKTDGFYYKAVLWAVENSVTSGTGNGKFSPDAACTRGQVVTFLYRASKPADPEVPKLAFLGEMTLAGEDMNASTLRGMQEFARNNGCEVVTREPEDPADTNAVKAEIDAVIADGCKLVVMTGFMYADACMESAAAHPKTSFLLLDVSEFDCDGTVPQNVALVTYKEEQAGFLAGYAAVADGCSELGFLGGFPYPAMIRYGYGFVQGADAAALYYAKDVHIKYWYANSFAPTDEITEKMKGWYEDGTEVVFACGGGIVASCIEAAEEVGGRVIGVDVDQSGLSDCVMTSAMKDLYGSVQLMLDEWFAAGSWPAECAGAETRLGFLENAVALPMQTSRFTRFDADEYAETKLAFSLGVWTVKDECDAEKHPDTVRTTVDWQ